MPDKKSTSAMIASAFGRNRPAITPPAGDEGFPRSLPRGVVRPGPTLDSAPTTHPIIRQTIAEARRRKPRPLRRADAASLFALFAERRGKISILDRPGGVERSAAGHFVAPDGRVEPTEPLDVDVAEPIRVTSPARPAVRGLAIKATLENLGIRFERAPRTGALVTLSPAGAMTPELAVAIEKYEPLILADLGGDVVLLCEWCDNLATGYVVPRAAACSEHLAEELPAAEPVASVSAARMVSDPFGSAPTSPDVERLTGAPEPAS